MDPNKRFVNSELLNEKELLSVNICMGTRPTRTHRKVATVYKIHLSSFFPISGPWLSKSWHYAFWGWSIGKARVILACLLPARPRSTLPTRTRPNCLTKARFTCPSTLGSGLIRASIEMQELRLDSGSTLMHHAGTLWPRWHQLEGSRTAARCSTSWMNSSLPSPITLEYLYRLIGKQSLWSKW